MNPVPSPAAFSTQARQLLLCCAVFVSSLSGSSMALAELPVYDVEVVIFSNQNSGDDGEHWPVTLPDNLDTQDFSADGQFSERPASSYRLDGIANGLRQSRGYSVLLHTAWRQPAYDSRNAAPYPVDAIVQNGTRRLAGQIKLVRERYLHLDVDLWLMSAAGAEGSAVYELNEKRRIKRSAVLHYFDHPRLGMIAVVTPWQSPEMQQQLEDEEAAAMEDAAADEESPAVPESPPADDQLTR